MSKETIRAHVVISPELVEEVDAIVGRRGRSRFFTEAVEEKLARLRLGNAAKKVVGSLADVDIPGWETSESAVEWVRSSRRSSDAKLESTIRNS